MNSYVFFILLVSRLTFRDGNDDFKDADHVDPMAAIIAAASDSSYNGPMPNGPIPNGPIPNGYPACPAAVENYYGDYLPTEADGFAPPKCVVSFDIHKVFVEDSA